MFIHWHDKCPLTLNGCSILPTCELKRRYLYNWYRFSISNHDRKCKSCFVILYKAITEIIFYIIIKLLGTSGYTCCPYKTTWCDLIVLTNSLLIYVWLHECKNNEDEPCEFDSLSESVIFNSWVAETLNHIAGIRTTLLMSCFLPFWQVWVWQVIVQSVPTTAGHYRAVGNDCTCGDIANDIVKLRHLMHETQAVLVSIERLALEILQQLIFNLQLVFNVQQRHTINKLNTYFNYHYIFLKFKI